MRLLGNMGRFHEGMIRHHGFIYLAANDLSFPRTWPSSLFLVEDVREVALPAVRAVLHRGHEDASAALDIVSLYQNKVKGTHRLGRALAAQTLNLAVTV